MLAEAVAKLCGFTYAPSETVYWQHGRSTERDFIYVTTQTLTHDQLQSLSDDVGEGRTLLVCCSAFHAKKDAFPNLTLKKIPAAVIQRCEWGRDDYSLAVAALPEAEEPKPEAAAKAPNRGSSKSASLPLFDRARRGREEVSAIETLSGRLSLRPPQHEALDGSRACWKSSADQERRSCGGAR